MLFFMLVRLEGINNEKYENLNNINLTQIYNEKPNEKWNIALPDIL
jgi:hypothetical protein